MHPKEIESVSRLSAFERYKYFINKVVDAEKLSVLIDEHGSLSTVEADGNIAVTLWPAPPFAEANAVDEWQHYRTETLDLHAFIGEYLPRIESNLELIAVFPVNEKSGFVVSTTEFLRDIAIENEKYS